MGGWRSKPRTAYQSRFSPEEAGVDLVQGLSADVPVPIPVHPGEHVAADAEVSEGVEDTPQSAGGEQRGFRGSKQQSVRHEMTPSRGASSVEDMAVTYRAATSLIAVITAFLYQSEIYTL